MISSHTFKPLDSVCVHACEWVGVHACVTLPSALLSFVSVCLCVLHHAKMKPVIWQERQYKVHTSYDI